MLPTPERSPLTLAEPSKERPHSVLAVRSLLAVAALPEMPMPQVPEAPPPVFVTV